MAQNVVGDPCKLCGRRKQLLTGLVWLCAHCDRCGLGGPRCPDCKRAADMKLSHW